MTIEEWKKTASKEAVEQYEKPVGWFKYNVKCCRNCKNWNMDPTLIGDYALNACNLHTYGKNGNLLMTKWDYFCDEYDGQAKEENLIDFAKVNWEADG